MIKLRMASAACLGVALCGAAAADFTGFTVDDLGGGVYRLYAEFDEMSDTVVNAFNADITNADGWFHDDVSGGTWLPGAGVGAGDSWVTIGGEPAVSNTTALDPNFDDNTAGQTSLGLNAGWFNSSPPNNQGNAGIEMRVLLAQFSENGAAATIGSLQLTYANAAGDPIFGTGDFTTGPAPAPGAFALLGLAGFVRSRRRR